MKIVGLSNLYDLGSLVCRSRQDFYPIADWGDWSCVMGQDCQPFYMKRLAVLPVILICVEGMKYCCFIPEKF